MQRTLDASLKITEKTHPEPFCACAPGYLSPCVGFFTAAVWCVPALRVPLVHSLINHFRKKLGLAVGQQVDAQSMALRLDA